ncbi:MAG: alpha-glucan family phosphorylase [Acidobacteriota bacterium]
MTTQDSPKVAYFCMEFALRDELPIYAGGLGVLAGDVLKGARDLDLPMIGIGLLWAEGYAVQSLDESGWQRERQQELDRSQLRELDVAFSVEVEGREIPLRAHEVVGDDHVPLYLIEPSRDEDSWITRRLYQGGGVDRVVQEILLGVGGVRLLRAMNWDFDVLHLNEGHAVFAGLELARERKAEGASTGVALETVRDSLVFTTHTPVVAGNEAHDVGLLVHQGVGLGCFDHDELRELAGEPFSMTVAGLRLSRHANAVAQLHGSTARHMWADVENAAPIVGITNGVHVPTWQDRRFTEALSEGGDLWDVHRQLKGELLEEIRRRTEVSLDPDALLLGFARRAAPYKRADLVFGDIERLMPWLEEGRLQLVFAGKAHPDHEDGKHILQRLHEMTRRFSDSVVFLEDYGLELGRLLTRGCDAWLNTPRRPKEASGTSGMKAALNGVLNISVLDGWWAEGCDHGHDGWQFGDGYEGHDQDGHDLRCLMEVLESEVFPTFNDDRERWAAMMRASAEMAERRFSATRMVSDYDRLLYRARLPR